MDDELLDVVDGFDEVIGTVNRKDYQEFLRENRGYIRAADLFIVNDRGELWAPIRTDNKTIAPGGYDYSAGGHVGAGEDYLGTIVREAEEELNLVVDPAGLEFVAKLKSVSIRYIREVYLLRSNDTPDYNPDDFKSASWMSPDALIAAINAGHPAKSNLCDTVAVLQVYLAGR